MFKYIADYSSSKTHGIFFQAWGDNHGKCWRWWNEDQYQLKITEMSDKQLDNNQKQSPDKKQKTKQ